MNYRELIKLLTPLYGAGEARDIVLMVMEERFGLSQTDLLLGKDTTLSRDERKEFEKIAARLVACEPVQYVLGYAMFCGQRFRVTPDVLIPRPETEALVHHVNARLEKSWPSPAVLDLCTGSGCIAISVALACPKAHVVGVDVSEADLAVARENARDLGVDNVSFLECDILQKDMVSLVAKQGRLSCPTKPALLPDKAGLVFDVIVSNPPYVRESEAATMSPHVLGHEPNIALFVPDEDPLRFYRAIADIGRQCLKPGGAVLAEVNTALADETQQLFIESGYVNVNIFPDQFDRPRILSAQII